MRLEHVWLAMTEALHRHETVHIIVPDDVRPDHVHQQVRYCGFDEGAIDIRSFPTNDVWARDSGPALLVQDDGEREAARPLFKPVPSLGLCANFYVRNDVVLVPVYGDVNDAEAMSIIAEHFPEREVVGILAHVLAELGGMIYCMTQQQPAAMEGNG
jgi:agmatine/peptidylarginine deiminase